MSEDNDNKKKDLTVGGVSGSKKMRLGRVHKKKTEDAPEAAAPAVEAKVEAPAPAPAPAEEVKPAKKPAAKKPAEEKAEEKPAEEKKPAKKTAAKTEKSEKTEKAEPSAKKPAAKKSSEKKETEAKAEEAPAEEKKPSKKAAPKAPKAEEKPEKKAEEPAAKAPETKEVKEEKKPEAKPEVKPEVKPEPVKEEKKPEAAPVPPKPRLSSAVISLPDVPASGETIRSSTVITYSGRDKKSPMRSGGQGGYNNNRGGGFQKQGGGFQKPAGGGFDKDKDDDNQRPQFKRAPKPRAEAPIEDAKKSRSSYAEKSAFEKKHNNNERRDGEKNSNIDKRKQSRSSQFTGRVNSDGDYDDYSFKKKKKKQESQQNVVEQVITEIKIPAFITVKEFAEGIGKKSSDIIMALMKLGVMATINQELDFDTACLVADSFGINAELLVDHAGDTIPAPRWLLIHTAFHSPSIDNICGALSQLLLGGGRIMPEIMMRRSVVLLYSPLHTILASGKG